MCEPAVPYKNDELRSGSNETFRQYFISNSDSDTPQPNEYRFAAETPLVIGVARSSHSSGPALDSFEVSDGRLGMARSGRQVRRFPRWLRGAMLTGSAFVPLVASAAPITYTDIASTPSSGITYRRIRSVTDASFDAIKLKPFMSLLELNSAPEKSEGAPGVALLDYDNDGDLDIYVTNGPGRANSLYQNRFAQTGTLSFVDVATAAGVDATDQDSTGVCFGDIDNDGDEDLMVLGRMEPDRLFQNNGNGTFTNVTSTAGVGGGARGHTGCTMGDINNDGLLDIAVGNTFDWSSKQAIFNNLFGYGHQNELYLNKGGNLFQDVSITSGIQVLENVPQGNGTISWGVVMVDYDQDGFTDLIHGDDQGAMPPITFAGVNRGLIQIFHNDGTAHFNNVTKYAGLANHASAWMGFSFGDMNSDGKMDMFVPSVGDYLVQEMGIPVPPGFFTSKLFLGADGGTFTDPTGQGPGNPISNNPPATVTPFGWVNQMFDYDNNGTTDIAFYGALDGAVFITVDNPGIVMSGDGAGHTTWDRNATASSADMVQRQIVQGMAVGDLNNDGFSDMVHVSSAYFPATKLPLIGMQQHWGSPFDAVAAKLPTFTNIGPLEWEWTGVQSDEGLLGVQLNSANNGNKWVKVRTKGSKGLATGGKVNRDGIGAIVKFTPDNGKQVMSPVLGGSSYASEHSLTQGFGLGAQTQGTVDIMWPGKVNNRLYAVQAGETIVYPEIPCDFKGTWSSIKTYTKCVDTALTELGITDGWRK